MIQKPIVYEALCSATSYSAVQDANLSGMSFTAIKDLLMRKYQQIFPTLHTSPLKTRKFLDENQQIVAVQSRDADKRHQLACEAFGYRELPKLQTVVYKLETKFRDDKNIVTKKEESIRCRVKFKSANVLESLRITVWKKESPPPLSRPCSLISPNKEGIILQLQMDAHTDPLHKMVTEPTLDFILFVCFSLEMNLYCVDKYL